MSILRDELPRLFAQNPRAMEAVKVIEADDEALLDHLIFAAGICQGNGCMSAAAACLVAARRLFPGKVLG